MHDRRRRCSGAPARPHRRWFVSKKLSEFLAASVRQGDQFAVVMTDLMPKVPEHRTVRLVHALPQRLAMGVVALGEIKGDEPVLITGDDLAVST